MNPPNPQRKSGLAVASLMLGIIGSLTVFVGVGLLLAVLAVILGHIALTKIKKSSGTIAGGGMAIGGLVTGYLTLALCALSIPTALLVIGNARQRGQMTQVLLIGQQMSRVQVFWEVTTWPKSAVFPTSTAVITNLVERGSLQMDYANFSAPGLTTLNSTNAAEFHAKNNAWCFVADLNEADPDQVPFLFTRNLRVSNLAELQGRVGDQMSDAPPFGRKGVAIVFKNGYAQILKPDMLWSNLLGGRTFTNRVLRP